MFQIDRGNLRMVNKHKSLNKIDAMKDIDSDPSYVQSASQESLLYVFEDNEAVIKLIMKGRSPTMRHGSRTHRVALDWLFDRKIWKLADVLTKGNFTRDELLVIFRQFQSVACREYTRPRDDRASQPKGWIQGNMGIGAVLEVTTSFLHFKYGIEIRIKSVNQDDSHSWVRISYGTVKYVTDSIEDNTENLADPQEEQIPQPSKSVFAAR